tara:strand:+ start:5142 stop:5927 length:786 start_codon:yes stop_codon:yes gene_type:complete
MNIKFHRVVLATDDSPENLEFWPFVASAWNTWFPEVSVELAYITEKDFNDPKVKHMSRFGNLHLFRPNDVTTQIPTESLLSACQLLLTTLIGDGSVCLLSNINYFPMSRQGYKNATDDVENSRVLILDNNELVVNSDYLRRVLNPEKKTAGEILSSWKDQMNPYNPDMFFRSFINRGAKLNSIPSNMTTIDASKDQGLELSKLWQYEYGRCVVPKVPFSFIQNNLKLLIDFVGHNEVKFEGVEKHPKPHWIGVQPPEKQEV